MASRKSPFLKVFTKREPRFQLHESTMSFMSDDMGDLMKYNGTGARKSDLESLHESCSESHMDSGAFVREAPSPLLSRSSSLRDLQSHLSRASSSNEFSEDDGNRSQNTAPVQSSRSSGLNLSPVRSSSPRRPRISPGSLKMKGLFSSAKSPFSSKNKKAANSNVLGELAISSLSGDEDDGASGSHDESASNDEVNQKTSEHGKTIGQQQQKLDTTAMRQKKRRGGRRPGRKSAEEPETSLQNLPPADAEANVRTFNRSISTDTFAQFELGDHVPIKEKNTEALRAVTTSTVDANTDKTNSSSSFEDESSSSSEADDESVTETEAAASVAPSVTESTDDDKNATTTDGASTTNYESPPSPTRGRKVRVVVRQRRKSSRSRGRSRGKSKGRTPRSNDNSKTSNTTEERRRTSKDVEDEVRELLGLKPVSSGTTRKKEAPDEKSLPEKPALPVSKPLDHPSRNHSKSPAPPQGTDPSSKPSTSQNTPKKIDDPLARRSTQETRSSTAGTSPERSELLLPTSRNTGSLREVIPPSSNKFDESMAVLPGGDAQLDMDAGPVPTPRRSGGGVFGSLRKVLSDRSFSLSPRRMKSQRSLGAAGEVGAPGLEVSTRGDEEDEPLIEILSPPRKSKTQRHMPATLPMKTTPTDTVKNEDTAGEGNDAMAKGKDHPDKELVEAMTDDQTLSEDVMRRRNHKSKRRSKTPTPKMRVKDKGGRVRRRASLNNISTAAEEETAPAVALDTFVGEAINVRTGDGEFASPTKGRRASQSTRPRRKMTIAELEKSTTSLVAIDAIRDVGGPKGKSPRRRIRKRMTVDYSTTENDNKSSETTDKIRDLYGSPGALMEVNESSDRENEAEQPELLVAVVDDESDAEESDVEAEARIEELALDHAAEEEDHLETAVEATDKASIAADASNELGVVVTTEAPLPKNEVQPKNERVVDTTMTIKVKPTTTTIKINEAAVLKPDFNIPSPEEIRKEYARLQSELNLSKMRMRLACMEVSNLEREIQQLKDRLGTFHDF